MLWYLDLAASFDTIHTSREMGRYVILRDDSRARLRVSCLKTSTWQLERRRSCMFRRSMIKRGIGFLRVREFDVLRRHVIMVI
jgi:hypothetical protein